MDTNELLVDTQLSTEKESTDSVENTEKPLSERDFKIAYAKALKERKEKIRQNKEMVADLELEVSYWKAQADLLRYRFEKMDFFLKNLDIEPKYLFAVEEQKTKELESTVDTKEKPILD